MTADDEVAQQFKTEFLELLHKYGAIMSAKDEYKGYAECGEDIRITVELPAVYNEETKRYDRFGSDIDFGSYISAK